ncbi:MAG: pyridoxamine 5'-phosphate oxidase family protein [Actinobacteria bacterium]|nr:MAG: pyridoxamine 5'-phosphate oxidase family protein [Actinomycetota bacterium]
MSTTRFTVPTGRRSLLVVTGELFHDGNRVLQDRFDTRRLADRIDERLVTDTISDGDRAFIEARDMSYKGGDPGFVRVLDQGTVAFPNYDGNGMYLSMGNILRHPDVGLLFIDFENPSRLRLEGTASIAFDDVLLPEWPEAQFVVRIAVKRMYPNCPRYIHHYTLVERSKFVPRPTQETPVPDWKRSKWACDVLPAGDPAAEPAET